MFGAVIVAPACQTCASTRDLRNTEAGQRQPMEELAAHELVINGQSAVDELSRTVSQCTDTISSAASDLTQARTGKDLTSAASDLKQAVRTKLPAEYRAYVLPWERDAAAARARDGDADEDDEEDDQVH